MSVQSILNCGRNRFHRMPIHLFGAHLRASSVSAGPGQTIINHSRLWGLRVHDVWGFGSGFATLRSSHHSQIITCDLPEHPRTLTYIHVITLSWHGPKNLRVGPCRAHATISRAADPSPGTKPCRDRDGGKPNGPGFWSSAPVPTDTICDEKH